jgi:hypothetical protein
VSHSIDHNGRPAGTGAMHPSGLHRLLHPLWFNPVHGLLVKAVAPRAGQRVIDAGAGTGALSERLVTSAWSPITPAGEQAARGRLFPQVMRFGVEGPWAAPRIRPETG